MSTQSSSTHLSTLFSIINAINLSRTEDEKKLLAQNLLENVVNASREISVEEFTKFNDQVNKEIYKLVNSTDNNSKLAAVLLIEKLISFEFEDNTTKITRFANFLRKILPESDNRTTKLASRALGHLARVGGILTEEIVEFEVKRALEWLQGDRRESRRLASVLIIRELSENAPTFIYTYIPQLFDLLWVAVHDTKVTIREASAEAFKVLLTIISQRESQLRLQWYEVIQQGIMSGFKDGYTCSSEEIHGSLLILGELLNYSERFLDRSYREVSQVVLGFRDHKDPLVRKTVIRLLPILARYNPRDFAAGYLHSVMLYLLIMLKREKERGDALMAIGRISEAMGTSICPYLDSIFETVRELLASRRVNQNVMEKMYRCLNMLTAYVGEPLGPHLDALLELLFPLGLSNSLRDLVEEIAKHIPSLTARAQHMLLENISQVLQGRSYLYPECPGNIPTDTSVLEANLQLIDQKNTDNFVLALTTLGATDFTGHLLHELNKNVVASYLEHESAIVRKTAVITCCKLLAFDNIREQTSEHAVEVTVSILDKLINAAVCDPDADIRKTILSSINTSFDSQLDKHLAQSKYLRMLFMAINDESYSIKNLAITIIGRLATCNPAYVIPSLRITLSQVLKEFEYAKGSRQKEETAILLALVVSAFHTHRFLIPYIPHLTALVQEELTNATGPGLISAILMLLGHLAEISGPVLLPYVDPILRLLVDILQDQSSTTKREAALKTLGIIASNTGCVVDIYEMYPNIIDVMMNLLKSEQNSSLRGETIKLIGILGALDPYKQKAIMSKENSSNTLNSFNNGRSDFTDEMIILNQSSCEDYYPSVAMNALVKILRDPSLSLHHSAVIQSIMNMFKTLGVKCVTFLPKIIPSLYSVMKSPLMPGTLEFYFQQLSLLISIVKVHIRNYLKEIFDLIQGCWMPLVPFHNVSLQITIVSLVQSLAINIDHADFASCLDVVIPIMLQILDSAAEIFSGASASLPLSISGSPRLERHDSVNSKLTLKRTTSSSSFVNTGKVSPPSVIKIIPTLSRQNTSVSSTNDNTSSRIARYPQYEQLTTKLLEALVIFEDNVDEYMNPIISVICKLTRTSDIPLSPISNMTSISPPLTPILDGNAIKNTFYNPSFVIKKQAVACLTNICRRVSVFHHASRILHCFADVVIACAQNQQQNSIEGFTIINMAMDGISFLAITLRGDFKPYLPRIERVMKKYNLKHSLFEDLAYKLHSEGDLPPYIMKHLEEEKYGIDQGSSVAVDPSVNTSFSVKKLPVNQFHLQKSWSVSHRSLAKDEWFEWIRRLGVELLKESPSHALRACAGLAGVYYPLGKELLNAAFLSCWNEMQEQYQDDFVHSLTNALTSPSTPPEIIQSLLNLAEFMEHNEKSLPIDIRTLGQYARRCHAYAKALHYKEMEFQANPSASTIESLIGIYNQLQLRDAAVGILSYAQHKHQVELKETWYETLQRWEEALQAYERRQKEEPRSFDISLGRMRCLNALGEWSSLSTLVQETWNEALEHQKRAMAPLAAAAAWGLDDWDRMKEYVHVLSPESPDGTFFRAVLSIHQENYDTAIKMITGTRNALDTEVTALVGESYNRAYNVLVRVQMLTELEDVLVYKKSSAQPEKRETIRKIWMKRLLGCQRSVDVWQRILKVRSLVIDPADDMKTWIKYASLSRKSGRPGLSLRILKKLMGFKEDEDIDLTKSSAGIPPVIYAYLKHLWYTSTSRDDLKDTFKLLQEFSQQLSLDVGVQPNFPNDGNRELNSMIPSFSPLIQSTPTTSLSNIADFEQLLAKCYLKLGDWQVELQEGWDEQTIPDVIRNYYMSTYLDENRYKAWHSWALCNFDVIQFYEKSRDAHSVALESYIIPSLQGFFKSISLSKQSSLQDSLRLLSLCFKHGHKQDVYVCLNEGIDTVKIDVWLQVIPQLIARIHVTEPSVRHLVHHLLTEVGKAHPQALVYPLTVASKSQNVERKKSAMGLIDKMRLHSAEMIEQALLVSNELIRVAILWHEQWREGLEEASKLYYGNNNVVGMFNVLEPLHRMLEKGPETASEISFFQAFGRDLREAKEWCHKYNTSHDIEDMAQAWNLYAQTFRRINKQLPQLNTLELQVVSPKLLNANDLELAVPGTYKIGEPVVKIKNLNSTMNVITSKQRPRRLTILGSDGQNYQFLLKGHEDLRLDERVMQLFELVNTLLSSDRGTAKRHLSIRRYPVIPLSQNSGLIGWVPHGDTMHALIRDYRMARNIVLNAEQKFMLQMAPDYDHLTLLQKVEVFDYSLQSTPGQGHCLAKVLWLKSRNSEHWLDRRSAFTKSTAVMSMVGYILGLGDRHPSNLMLDRFTGEVIHIDFGDCFEVAMHREKFPEKIPFRLTRMLVNAMEVSGIEGSYRTTCEHVMRVLRSNRENLMAVLEAFVYDPLINWRIMRNTSPLQRSQRGRKNSIDSEYNSEENDSTSSNIFSSDTAGQDEEELSGGQDEFSSRSYTVINRVQNKLTGRDFKPNLSLDVPCQVDMLIQQATSLENLCQCYIGWCAFW